MGEKSVSLHCSSEEQFAPEQGEVNRGLVTPASVCICCNQSFPDS